MLCTRERENNFFGSHSLIKVMVMANLLAEIKRKIYGVILKLSFYEFFDRSYTIDNFLNKNIKSSINLRLQTRQNK